MMVWQWLRQDTACFPGRLSSQPESWLAEAVLVSGFGMKIRDRTWLQWPSLSVLAAAPVRTAKQIAGLRKACRIAREILDKGHAAIRPGVTTDEIDKVVSSHPNPLPHVFMHGRVHDALSCFQRGPLAHICNSSSGPCPI